MYNKIHADIKNNKRLYMDYNMSGFEVWIILFLIIILLSIIGMKIFDIFFIRKNGESNGSLGRETPANILKKQFAKANISKKEFDEIRKVFK